MRAVIVPEFGGVDALQVADVPVPEAGPGDVLIRVIAAGVNRGDLLQRQGFYPPPPGASDVLGLECSGEIVAVGRDVDAALVGSLVTALISGGGQAEYVAVPVGQTAPIPDGIDPVTAGGIMEAAATVWSNLVTTGRLTAGETLLVHGGASGIGSLAIQVGKALGARVVTTVGAPEKAEFVKGLGADLVINHREQDFADVLKAEDIRADVILDIIGAKYLSANVSALATEGRLVIIGLQGGIKAELNLAQLLAKRAWVTATAIRARSVAEKSVIVADVVEHVWPLFTAGTIRPIVHATLPLEQVGDAHRMLEESSHVGKVVLTLA